ncbi:ATP-binding cassette domain-containing protein [Segetibacter sp. 3557_3]|uniref:ABC transporter ATP-binding protein n=1 Tax=Segetibacter sp. 3557_3 TaxID=2547429 RepID=UPI00105901B6|nr:polysaccharide ABC transporter ATP-binding protein [Segetibacter sp. 3557_3]TDH20819.1 ATP-binding cassette domain-containing protein [Segetibacter sp. 3557_3]
MSEKVIEVENLSKVYRLGEVGTGTLSRDIERWVAKARGKQDPFTIIDEASGVNKPTDDIIWSLKDIDLTIQQGETLGIIGNNGAGKSTLLKLLSRITTPTKGTIKVKGKIASLLEVGTGFHPELTGRENIFLNGAILGMRKKEIAKLYDDIVQFAGVERYINTPVKRYSSGMYIRLAFSVAAHLETDILIVDEVLAVGDADFQKKCLGRMEELSGKQGRTILMVSHNLQAIANLCENAIWLDKGQIAKKGKSKEVVKSYTASTKPKETVQSWEDFDSAPGNELIKLRRAVVKPVSAEADAYITVRTPVQLNFEFWCNVDDGVVNINVILLSTKGECIFNLGSHNLEAKKGVLALQSTIPANLLNNKTYTVSLGVMKNNAALIADFQQCIQFEVEDIREGMYYFDTWPGLIRPEIDTFIFYKNPDKQ